MYMVWRGKMALSVMGECPSGSGVVSVAIQFAILQIEKDGVNLYCNLYCL
jgi:hypothetical protein